MSLDEMERDQRMAYGIFRLALGINILIHGVGRIFGPGARGFASKTAEMFVGTPLSHWAVYGFLLALPFIEAALGVLLTLGLFTRWALVAGGLLMVCLIFGTGMRSDWTTVGIQMIYSITYFLLLFYRRYNVLSLDSLVARSRPAV
ncbi:MAG TPA: DoxX family protein [Candidatus Acidoferrales bacterium]|jgi:thiosulfate dehydrogenase [quinone] large subunit|nr:DoxX family protein [Candidatus Acidoferrales bacterium]